MVTRFSMFLLALVLLVMTSACMGPSSYYAGVTTFDLERDAEKVNAEFRSGKEYKKIQFTVNKNPDTGLIDVDLTVEGASGAKQFKENAKVWIEGIKAVKEIGKETAPLMMPSP